MLLTASFPNEPSLHLLGLAQAFSASLAGLSLLNIRSQDHDCWDDRC